MKTKRILAMLMAMCMLAACSMVVSAGGETPVINYLSLDPIISGGLPANADCFEQTQAADGTSTGMTKVEDSVDFDNDGQIDANYYFSLNSGLWTKSGQGSVSYQTNENIPAQKYLFSVWYNTDTPYAHVRFQSGVGNVYITFPSTNGEWKQFFVVWDAAYGKTTADVEVPVLDPETGEAMKDSEGNAITETLEDVTVYKKINGEASTARFAGVTIHLIKPKHNYKTLTSTYENSHVWFCNPVLTPFTEDMTGIFETGKASDYEHNSIYMNYTDANGNTKSGGTNLEDDKYDLDIDKMFNILGTKIDSVTATSNVILKSAKTDLAVNTPDKILLATYNGNQLTGIQIVDATLTAPVKDPNSDDPTTAEVWIPSMLSCTIPDDLSGEVKAFFWDSISGLKPLADPATFTVE